MKEKLNLAQISARYKKCTKTFKKYVREYNIPHEKLGRDMIFEPDKVTAHLERLALSADQPRDLGAKKINKQQKSRSDKSSRYAGLLGL